MGTIHGTDLRASDAFFHSNGYTPAPRLVQWMSTARCSYGCPHCLTADLGASAALTTREAKQLIDQVAALGVHEMLVTGGEPLERPDLPELIDHLAGRGQRWSLNTARKPTGAILDAMARWPPGFAAVSLDGPKQVHDAFRGRQGAFDEAIESIAILSELTGGSTAIGTTVTRSNYGWLAETLRVVAGSDASTWGLHLVVPEGRAAMRKDLLLTDAHVQGLLRFVASKRGAFPVMMADEIGYCGDWEPLVRDEPFFCGAGRAQCVVLPDGEVVACTTADRRNSAGNVRTASLESIWRDGFKALRRESVSGKCRDCAYAPACGGGCWLQRRHGTHCFKRAWERPSTLTTTAGAAVCLGLAACRGAEPPPVAPAPPAQVVSAPVPAVSSAPPQAVDAGQSEAPTTERLVSRYGFDLLDWMILEMYMGRLRSPVPARLEMLAPKDPGFGYLATYLAGPRPQDLVQRAAQMRAALATRQRSLQLGLLMWRDLTEWCLDGPTPATRTEEQKKTLREAMGSVRDATNRWRTEIFDQKLEPFMNRDGEVRGFFRSKAGPPPELIMGEKAAQKHWPNAAQLTRDYLTQHPLGEQMLLRMTPSAGASIERLTPQGRAPVKAGDKLGVFDLLMVGPGKGASLTLTSGTESAAVALPAGTELTYGDVLRLAYEQNRAALDSKVQQTSGPEASPLLLPALRAKIASSGDPEQRLRIRLDDLWMF
ncbi:MAG: radical SAM protein [Deltaproteobacteria bacterium]|nr:radical SAM protein [Deltaproteobacteria bacterium]